MPEATKEWHEDVTNKAFCDVGEPENDTADEIVADGNDVAVDEWGEAL